MIPSEKSLSLYMRALEGLSLRQRVISHNIANQSTPGFHAKRVDFEDAMQAAIRDGGDARGVEFHVRETGDEGLKADGNNVFLEKEWMLMEKTRLLHQLFSRAVGGTFRTLLQGIRGR